MVISTNDPHPDRDPAPEPVAGSGRTGSLGALFDALALSELDRMSIGDLARHGPDPDDGSLLAMLGLLFAALAEGSLCLRLDPDHLSARYPKTDVWLPDDWASGFMRRLDQGCYDSLIDRNGGGFKPLVLDDATGRRLLYFQKFHYHEQRLKQRLQALLASPPALKPADATIAEWIDGLYRDDTVIRTGSDATPMVRDPGQVDAIRAALTHPLLIISGGPGTGKTSLLTNLLRALVRSGIDPGRIVLAAPTGRAAQRMSESLAANLAGIVNPDSGDRALMQLSGSTIHKLLVYRARRGDFLHGEAHPIAADVIVVDEVSMVDVVMMDRLLGAVEPGRTRVILIGDKDQLPSVEAGSVLADMSLAADCAAAGHLVVLERVYRSHGPLRELAAAVNAGRRLPLQPAAFERALKQEPGQWAFVSAGDGEPIHHCLDQWAAHQYLRPPAGDAASYAELVRQIGHCDPEGGGSYAGVPIALVQRLFALANRCRILTVERRGTSGANWVNQRIGDRLRQILDPVSDPASCLFHGAVIMITRNDYTRDLFNGDFGVVLRHPGEGSYQVHFHRSGTLTAFPAPVLSDWEPAFAMTVHKSQGSEFEDALLLLPQRPDHRLLTREILYTAATRASRRLIVYGTQAAFLSALERKIERQSGLMG